MNKEKYQTGDLIFALIILSLAFVFVALIPFETRWYDKLVLVKQPSFWPTLCLLGMSVFSIGYSYKIYRLYQNQQDSIKSEWLEVFSWVKPVEYIVYFLIYVYLVPLIGYLISTLLFFSLLTYRVGYRTRKMICISLLTAFSVVVIFKSLLQVKMASGEIYDYLPNSLATFFIVYF